MRFLKQFLFGLTLSLTAASGAALAADPTNGTGYITLSRPQPSQSSGKVEVLEFFSYHCPHCYGLDPTLTEWVKRHKDDVNFKRAHVVWGEPDTTTGKMMASLQRAFYTLEALGKGEELHKKLFDAIHAERQPLMSDDAIAKWMAKQGIDQKKYLDTANSFTVQSKGQAARQAFSNYNLDSVPAFVIDGRFVTSPSLASRGVSMSEAQANGELIKLLDQMVAKLAPAKPGAKPAASAAAPAHAASATSAASAASKKK